MMTVRSRKRYRRLIAGMALASGLFSSTVSAHKPSDSYLTLTPAGSEVGMRWDIALRDLDTEMGLDVNDDGILTWGEVRRQETQIRSFALSNLVIRSNGTACELIEGSGQVATPMMIDTHSDGAYAVLSARYQCPMTVRHLDVEYRLFHASDPTHRGIVRIATGSGFERSAVMGPDLPIQGFQLDDPSILATLRDFVHEGIWHIWLGFDHILFLMALLLPSVLRRDPTRKAGWLGAGAFKPALLDVVKIVTAFTVAHSITLTLAVLGFVSLPSRLVESAIALTVILAAVNNLWPVLKEKRWMAAFGFGLIHGFGFASALKDLGLPRGALAVSLFGFNAGVEIGQLTLVALFFPTAYFLRNTTLYRVWVLRIGSVIIACLAAIWLTERVFDLRILTF